MELIKLKKPFPSEKIHWRVGATFEKDGITKGLALAYIDARDLYERLDDVCGAENWQIRYPQANGKTTCEIGIKINDEWVWKANGAGDTATEAEKGAYSDAAKRAGVPWGIAAYLYDMTNIYVQLKKRGKSWVIDEAEKPKLIKAHNDLVSSLINPATDDEIDSVISEANLLTTLNDYNELRNTKAVPLRKRANSDQQRTLDENLGAIKKSLTSKMAAE